MKQRELKSRLCYFIKLCRVLTTKLNVFVEEITSADLHDKTVQANGINSESCSA